MVYLYLLDSQKIIIIRQKKNRQGLKEIHISLQVRNQKYQHIYYSNITADIGMPTPCTTSDAEATCMVTSIGQAIEREIERKSKSDLVAEESHKYTITTLNRLPAENNRCVQRPIRNCEDVCSILLLDPSTITYQRFFLSSDSSNKTEKKHSIKKSNYTKPHTIFVFSFLIKGMFF